jgi:NAD(P)-dependent dehydrogenase (short-subunit alcohol dehydrogenase family)
MRLLDKRAIVVGAGQTPGDTIGNGRAIATLFARQGAKVLCVDRDGERAQSVAMEIGGVGFAGDVTDAGVCSAMVSEAQKQFGGVDIVVNNVGIGGGGDGPAHLAEEAAFDRIIDVNLKAAWLVIKSALPALRQSHGAIVNISSLASLAGANMIAYELSKAALNRLTLSVALSNAKHGVRCNAILPGLMDTPMAIEAVAAASGKSLEEVRAARSARVPLNGKMGDAWDTANAALFLASQDAKFITGALLPVDGGMSARVG